MNVVDINIRSLIALENADQGEALIGIKKRCYPKRMMRVFTTPIPKYRSLTVTCPLPSRISENRSTYSLYKKKWKKCCVLSESNNRHKMGCRNVMFGYKACVTSGNIDSGKKNRERKEKKRRGRERTTN